MTVMLDAMYRSARQRVSDVVGMLSAEQLRTPVPATPGWTIHELLAHLVGGAADLASGRLDGAPGDEWTARHVAERRQRPLAELLGEWSQVGPQAESSLAGQDLYGPNLASDIICHEGDLREALGLPRPDREHWQTVLEAMLGRLWPQLRDSVELVIQRRPGAGMAVRFRRTRDSARRRRL
jgi:uncharacterized protein (TIGR03083 family)